MARRNLIQSRAKLGFVSQFFLKKREKKKVYSEYSNAQNCQGLAYLTSTDGNAMAGRTPERAFEAYASLLRPCPWPNEQGLRVLAGAALRGNFLIEKTMQ